MPLVQDSMDVFVFQKLEEKTSRINDIWFRGDRGNVLDLESMDPEEIKLALITGLAHIGDGFDGFLVSIRSFGSSETGKQGPDSTRPDFPRVTVLSRAAALG
jgi:hypothetical protein